MAKKKKHHLARKQPARQQTSGWQLNDRQQVAACIAVIIILVFGYFAPIAFEGKEPRASDSIAWKGATQSIKEAREKYGETPLWATNVFAGMPSTMISLRPPFQQPARFMLTIAGKLVNWRIVHYVLGAIGIFLLMRFWGVSNLPSLLASLAFIWWPYLIGLMEAGHNTKLRAIMLVPFILLTFLRLMKEPGLLTMTLFAISFSLGILANHYQILFYALLVLLAFGVMQTIPLLRQKLWKAIGVRIGLAFLAVALAAGSAAFPTLLVKEYSKYSIRGGTGEPGSQGLSFKYATDWSFYPGEIATWVMPRFYGGSSAETYESKAVPQLRGRKIPGYWGPMPFTSSTHYFGVVTLFLVALALALRWRDSRVLTLAILVVFSLLLSFGKHFPLLYQFFFDHVPFFNKFRVPSMILVLIHWGFVLLAGLGLAQVLTDSPEVSMDKLRRVSLVIFGAFLLIGLVPFLFKSSFALARPDDARRFQPQVFSLIREARYDMMKQDALRMLVFAGGVLALITSYSKAWLPRTVFAIGIIALLVTDLFSIDNRFMQNLVRTDRLEQYFAATETDLFLSKDSSTYRILPLGRLDGDNRWCYRHESIGGYHPAKLRIFQDINEFCLYQGKTSGFGNTPNLPINWNIIKMLNVKYLLSNGPLNHQNLTPAFTDTQNRITVYQYTDHLPRLFCVGKTELIPDRRERFARLNDPSFDPAETAILEKSLPLAVETPTNWEARITRYQPNVISARVNSDQQTLLVLSEVYYPAGWHAYVDGKETEIFKTDHILRSIVVPAGSHEIVFRLRPESYQASLWIKGISVSIMYLLFGLGAWPVTRRVFKKKQSATA
ncbi:MAG: YfhO family protein [bacterium]